MKLEIKDATNASKGKADIPIQFSEEIRPDLVHRAVITIQSHKRQPYGAKPEAGKRSSAKVSRRRRDYRGAYGLGISRVPRKVHSRRGTRMNWVGAFAPNCVGGRRAHPPKAEKIWTQKINTKERRKAIRSALAATLVLEIVKNRGHFPPETYPFIIDDSIESISKTKEVILALETLGLKDELSRSKEKKIRSGKGKNRGRPYRKKKGPLIVVSKQCPLLSSAINIPGVDAVIIDNVNAELLAPGASIGRLTLYTASAIKKLAEKKLFI